MNVLNVLRRFRFSSRLTTQIDDPWKASELYVILDSKQSNGSRSNAMECFPDSVFTKIHDLISQPLSLSSIADTSTVTNFPSTLFECKNSGDLQKLQNMDFEAVKSHDIFIAVNENWNFDAVRKLPWKLHNQGLSPFFIDANRNSIWQKDWKVFKRLSEKGVILPIDLMAVARWQRNQSNWLQMSFGEGRENSLQRLSAVYLMELQVTPPYYIYESDIDQWMQWVSEGSVNLGFKASNRNEEQD